MADSLTTAVAVANDCYIEIRDIITYYVPCFDPFNNNRIIVQKELSKNNNNDFSFYERTTLYKNKVDATNFLFDLGVESGFVIPLLIVLTFEINTANDQSNDSTIANEMNVTECICKISSVSYSDHRRSIYYGADNFNVAHKEIVIFNRNYIGLLDSIKPYINPRTFKSNKEIYIFDTRYRTYHIGAQAIQPNFKFMVLLIMYVMRLC